MKAKSKSAQFSLLAAAAGLITLIVFSIYGAVYDYFDYIVALTLALGVVCAVGYALIDRKIAEYLNLVQVILTSYSLGLFFLNSHPVWADRLNNIDMYGARGSLVPVIALMVLFLITVVCEIISCFMGKEAA